MIINHDTNPSSNSQFPKCLFKSSETCIYNNKVAITLSLTMGDQMNSSRTENFIKHYNSSHKILLVGEGNFSFSTCLASAFGSAPNMVATSLDSKRTLLEKYHSQIETTLDHLKELGCSVIHGVDVITMRQHPCLRHELFDRIVFNFPHAGFRKDQFREHSIKQIKLHQKLVSGFLRNAKEMLSENGEIHITHKTAYPFNEWEIEELAEEEGLVLKEEACFCLSDYPGYINKKGTGSNCNETFPVGLCSTFKFVMNNNNKSLAHDHFAHLKLMIAKLSI